MYDYQIDYKKIVKFETLIVPTIKWLVKLTSIATFIFFFLKICNILTCSWALILIPILIFYVLAVFIPIGLYCYWLLTCMFYLKHFVNNMNCAESFIQKCKRHPENEALNLFKDNNIIFDGHHFSLHNKDEENEVQNPFEDSIMFDENHSVKDYKNGYYSSLHNKDEENEDK